MRRVFALLPLLLGACGPDLVLVDFSFTIANQSGFDMAAASVCVNDGVEEVCTDPFSMASEASGTSTTTLFAYEGDQFDVVGIAIDSRGEGYVWGPRTYEIDGPFLDTTVVFTQGECCFDL